jgi:hypothetical protein
LMEIPAVLIGATVFRRDWKALIQTLRDPEIVILLASLLFGCLGGPKLLEGVAVLVVQPFNVVLGCFLFEMGQRTAGSLPHIRRLGAKLITFGVLMPLLGGSLAALAGTAAGMPTGDVILLSTLSASASYVAATAAMSRLVKPNAIATSLTVALGVTLPFNMLAGIQLYAGMARQMQGLSITQFRDTAVSEIFAHLPVAMVPAVALTLAIGLGFIGLLLLVAKVVDVARRMVPALSATLKARLIQVVELIGRNSQVMIGWLGQPQRRTSYVLPAARCLRVAGGSELASQGALRLRSRWLGERSGSPARSVHLHSAGNDPPHRYSFGYC